MSISTIPRQLKLNPRFTYDEKGKKREVTISYANYRKIERILEDFFDVKCGESRLKEKGTTLEELKKEMEADGII